MFNFFSQPNPIFSPIIIPKNPLTNPITSDDFPYKWTLLDDNRIPSDTVLGEYFESENTDDVRNKEEVYASDWFNYVKKSDVDRVFYEYCLPYKNKAISLIWEE